MAINIEKGVPLIKKGHGPGRHKKYPWGEMRPGDSFAVSCPGTGLRKTIQSGGTLWFRRNGDKYKVTSRKEGLDSEGNDIVRFWCIEK